MIVFDSLVPADRESLGAWARRESIAPAETFDSAIDAVCSARARLVITDLDAWPPGAAQQIVQQMKCAAVAAPLILRTDLSLRALLELPVLSNAGCAACIHVSFRPKDPLDQWLTREFIARQQSATFALLSRFSRLVPSEARHAFVATAVMCDRLVTMQEIGATLGMADDKLRRLHHACGLPHFPATNAALLAAHALALTEAIGGLGDATAARMGFEDLKALNKYMRYHFHSTLQQLSGDGGSRAMLDRIGRWFPERRSPQH